MKNKKLQYKVLSPTAILGYGYPLESFMAGIREKPDLIAVDAGSTDPGPYYLGSGKSFTDRIGVKRDLRYMLKEGVAGNIPVVIGSAGGSGSASHLNWCKDIIKEIAVEEKLSFKMGVISADIPSEKVEEELKKGNIKPLPYVPELTKDILRETTNIVAQMGVEPIIKAYRNGCDVILCGRAYDPAVFSAIPIELGFDPGLAVHMGKILECAAIAASPGSGSDSVLGVLGKDSFTLKTLSGKRKFTRESTTAHSLYEKSDPYFLAGPGGRLNLSGSSFTEDENGVTVRGSLFEKSETYSIKLEGARKVGFRTVSIAGSRDPVMIAGIETILDTVRNIVQTHLKNEGIKGKLYFHIYGKNGVMGEMEPEKKQCSHEVGIIMEAISETQSSADTICSITRSTLLHYGYPGRISTAGNLAFPFSPSDMQGGAVYEFSIYHLMEIKNQDLFKMDIVEIKNGVSK